MNHAPQGTPGRLADILLLKLAGQRLTAKELGELAQALGADAVGGPIVVQGYTGLETEETYVYCRLPASGSEPSPELQARARRAYPNADIRWLRRVQDIAGASAGRTAPWHYIVETDVVPQADQDLNDWYNQEHLPGLASVPGTVRAERFACHETSPRYHSCYDLETLETFGSPPWLAVRATAWSDRVRPSFRNTKRTMFKVIA
jgi:hypothetical protein